MSTQPRPRRAGLLLVAATLLFGMVWVSVLVVGPESVPGHFGVDGAPTRWDPTVEFLGFMALVAGVIALLFAALPLLIGRAPIEHVNVPNRELWSTSRRREHLNALITEDLRLIGASTMLLLAAILVISAFVGLGGTVPGWVPVTVTVSGAFLVLVGLVVGRMVTGGRYVPAD